jgi:hypothetical protein
MNGKETIVIVMLATALLATILTITSPIPALALSRWNLDEDPIPDSGFANGDMVSPETESIDREEENRDEDSITATTDDEDGEDSEDGDNSNDKKDSSHVADGDLQACLSDAKEEGSPTEQKVQDCMES